MLRIYKPSETLIRTEAWDFSLEEVPYLLDEHDGEAFVLMENRLWEAEEPMLNLNHQHERRTTMNTMLKEPRTLKDLVCTAAPLPEALKNLLGKDRISLVPIMEVFA